jgi:DNA-binding transcriptional ArsR family regulator
MKKVFLFRSPAPVFSLPSLWQNGGARNLFHAGGRFFSASFFTLHRLIAMHTVKKNGKHHELSGYYKALAHPVRLAIIEKLFVGKVNSCNDFVHELSFAQATISEHLRKLKQAGLVTVNRKGPSSEYSLNKQGIRRFIRIQDEMKMLTQSNHPD